MDTLDHGELTEKQEVITPIALGNMSGMSPWMVLMGVLFIILALFMLLGGVGIFFGADNYSALGLKGAMQLMAVYYLISGGVFGFSGVLLVSSGSKASTFSKYPSSNLFEAFTAKQKSFWILMGVNGLLTIIFFIAFFVMASKLAKMASGGI